MSKIEEVAQAIYYATKPKKGWDGRSGEYRRQWLDMARAAIEAMREPTEAMVDAGQWQIDPVSLYQTFIGAALNEQVAG